jgi:thiol-disulfide isomerase/thioredoxin
MTSILFLSTDDFYTASDPSNNTVSLCHSIQGFSLLLFYSNHCVHCQDVIPIFRKLPELVRGCQIGLVNVSTNRRLIEITRQTTSPINYVPLIILYINGRPYMKYDGEKTDRAISTFVMDVSRSVHESGFSKTTKEKGIPSYTIGHPLKGENDVTYLEFSVNSGYHK